MHACIHKGDKFPAVIVMNKTQDDGNSILFDVYKGNSPVLRWYLQTSDEGTYVRLLLKPGRTEKEVKRWGPFSSTLFGLWHHVCFTVRFARKYTSTSSDPAAVIAQAYMFVDGEAPFDQESFAFKVGMARAWRTKQRCVARFLIWVLFSFLRKHSCSRRGIEGVCSHARQRLSASRVSLKI